MSFFYVRSVRSELTDFDSVGKHNSTEKDWSVQKLALLGRRERLKSLERLQTAEKDLCSTKLYFFALELPASNLLLTISSVLSH